MAYVGFDKLKGELAKKKGVAAKGKKMKGSKSRHKMMANFVKKNG